MVIFLQKRQIWGVTKSSHLNSAGFVQEFQKELSQWRKDPNGGKKKPKYSYKTVEELKAKGRISKQLAAPQKELSQVKVKLMSQEVTPEEPFGPFSITSTF